MMEKLDIPENLQIDGQEHSNKKNEIMKEEKKFYGYTHEMWANWPFATYFDVEDRWANWPNNPNIKINKKQNHEEN